MKRFECVTPVLLMLLIACQKSQPQPHYEPTATVRDIMLAILDPTADVVWNSVSTIVTADGVEERAPTTDEEWEQIRHAAITVVEGDEPATDARPPDCERR